MPGGPKKQTLACSSIQASCAQMQHERPLRRGLGAPVEVLERLQGRKRSGADPHAGTGGVAGEHLGLEQALEKLLVGPGLVARQGCCLLEPLQHPRRLQLAEQVGQPLARLRLRRAHAHSSA